MEIGSETIGHPAPDGYEIVAASPNSGGNKVAGESLTQSLAGA